MGARPLLRRKFLWVLVVGALIGAALYVAYGRTPGTEQVQRAIRTVTTPVTRGTLTRTISTSGQLVPLNDVTLAFTSAGRVVEVFVEPGEAVEAGAPLARMDDTNARLQFMRAQSEYEAAKVDAAPTQIEERRLALEVARRQLEETMLRAPFAGVVADVLVEEGNAVGERAGVVRLVDLSGYKVNVTVDESDVVHVRPGQEVTVRVRRAPQLALPGRVSRVAVLPSSAESVVLFPVEVVIDMEQAAAAASVLQPGLTVEVEIVVERAENVLVVPLASIVEMGGQSLVTRVRPDGTQENVPVVTGLSDGLRVEIRSGLEEGDEIITNNYMLYQTLLESGRIDGTGGSRGPARGFGPGGGIVIRR